MVSRGAADSGRLQKKYRSRFAATAAHLALRHHPLQDSKNIARLRAMPADVQQATGDGRMKKRNPPRPKRSAVHKEHEGGEEKKKKKRKRRENDFVVKWLR